MRERILHLTKNDFVMQTFRCGGKGGQNRDKRDTGVRFIHPPSGARGESREHRTQAQNRKEAFLRMAHSDAFQKWVRIAHAKACHDIDSWVEQQLQPENLYIEYGPFD